MSNGFNCLSHGLLIAKLEEYGFKRIELYLMYNYLMDQSSDSCFSMTYFCVKDVHVASCEDEILGCEDNNISDFKDDAVSLLKSFQHNQTKTNSDMLH